MGGLASKMDAVLAEIPMKEAVRYKKGNLKWTRSDIKSHSEALACGLLELGCKVRWDIRLVACRKWDFGGTLPSCAVRTCLRVYGVRV